MTWRDHLRPKSVAADAALVGLILIGANLLLDRERLGWTQLNPSPYLLVPLLIGARYGFTAGTLSGLATSLLVALLQRLGGADSLRTALLSAPFLHIGLLFLGGIAGELFGWFHRERVSAEAQIEKLRVSVRKLDADVRYLRGVKDELDRSVAARDGEVSTLDAELRRLYATAREDLPDAILHFLKRQVRLSDAALYSVGPTAGSLHRLSLIGHAGHLPPTLSAASSDLVRVALERNSLVTLPTLLQQRDPPADEHLLLAAPLPDADGRTRAILLVTGLPFITFTAQTANLIALICEWGGEVLDLASEASGRYRIVAGMENQRIFNRTHLAHLLHLALDAHRTHRLPSSVIIFELPGAPPELQSRFEKVLLGAVRAGDFAAELGWPHPHLLVLLPLTGERGAAIFIERCRQFLRHHGAWSVAPVIRKVEFGRAVDVPALLAEIEDRAPPVAPAP